MIVTKEVAITINGFFNRRIYSRHRMRDIGIVSREDTLANQFQKTAINDSAFIIAPAAIGDSDGIAIIGITITIDALKVAAAAQRARCCICPTNDRVSP